MKKNYININGKDYGPLSVGFGECCLNCDLAIEECVWQCHDFEDNENQNVALKIIKHKESPTLWQRIKGIFMPIESDTPF